MKIFVSMPECYGTCECDVQFSGIDCSSPFLPLVASDVGFVLQKGI